LVLKVSFKLKEILDSAGYSVFLTRETDQAETNSGKRLTLVERNVFANKKKADYFISIHSDSSANTKATGSHSIYREPDDEKYNKRQFEFAKDILKYYTVVKNRYKLPVKNESPEETKRVLTTGNKSLRKVIVELGFTTNPSDYEKMANSIDQIAIELAKGLEENISKHYSLKTNNILGYEFEGKVYKNKPRPFGYKVIYDTVPIEKSL
jgi:N-acetylmuramoyl-L-alanine amidase